MDRLGPYKISGELGRGGMGVVYRGRDDRIGRDVAIKTIKLSHENTQEQDVFRQRLLRDAQLAGILSHPGIVTVYELAEEGDVTYIVMELVNGPTLHEMVARPGGIQLEDALEVLRQTAGALDYAHKKGVVHRDIKPANIMVAGGDTVKIVDFGTAKLFTAAQTQTGFLMGTPYYMSPEQVYSKPLDGRSDQFALAVIAFEILVGHRPFQGDSLPSLVHKIVSEPPQMDPGDRQLSPGARAVLEKALAKNPEDRYATCCAFVKELDAKLLVCEAPSTTPAFTQSTPQAVAPSSGPLLIGVGGKTITIGTGLFSRIGRKKAVFATSGLAIALVLAALLPQYLSRDHASSTASSSRGQAAPSSPIPEKTVAGPQQPASPAVPVPPGAPPQRDVRSQANGKQQTAKELADAAKKQAKTELIAKMGSIAKAGPLAKIAPVTVPPVATPPVVAAKPALEAAQSGSGCLADYTGVPSGTITWSGQLDQPGSVQISGANASAGRLSGKLPRVPIQISGALPAGATIVQHPTDANKCAPLTIRITDPQVTSIRFSWQAQ